MVIEIPESLDNESIKRFLEAFSTLNTRTEAVERIVLDFSYCAFVSPAAIALLAGLIDDFRDRGKNVVIRQPHSSRVKAFFQNFGLFRSSLEDAYQHAMQQYTVELRRCLNSDHGLYVANTILPHIVSRTRCSESVAASLNWSLWELFDNAGCHGYQCYDRKNYPKPVYTCMFSYSDRIEIALFDRGIGVFESLRKVHSDLNESDCLDKAIERGVSGNPSGSPGLGLYGASEFAFRGAGRFHMWSSDRGIKIRTGKRTSFSCPGTLGTLVSLGLNRDGSDVFEQVLKRSSKEWLDDNVVQDE